MEALTIEQIIEAPRGKSLICRDTWYGTHDLTEIQSAEQSGDSVLFTGAGYRYGIYVDNNHVEKLIKTGHAEKRPSEIEQCTIRTSWDLR